MRLSFLLIPTCALVACNAPEPPAEAPRAAAVSAPAVDAGAPAVVAPAPKPPHVAPLRVPPRPAPVKPVPDAPNVTPLEAKGAELFGRLCALCHGKAAEGYAADNAPSLKSPTFLATATDDFLRAGIERGRPGTAMGAYGRAFGGPLEAPDVAALVAFVRAGTHPPRVELPLDPVAGDAGRGKPVFERECTSCHGTPTQREDALHLANPTLLQTASDAFLRYAVVHGRPGTRMPAFDGTLNTQDVDDVVAYLRSLAPTGPVEQPVPPGLEPAPALDGPIVLNPKGKPASLKLKDDRLVSLDDLKKALDGKRRLVIVDARAPSEWRQLHITGSVPLPYYDLAGIDKLPNDGTWIVAYCACPHHASGVVVDELRKRGVKTSAVLDEGVFAWKHKGYPVVAAEGALPVPAPPRTATETPPPPRPRMKKRHK